MTTVATFYPTIIPLPVAYEGATQLFYCTCLSVGDASAGSATITVPLYQSATNPPVGVGMFDIQAYDLTQVPQVGSDVNGMIALQAGFKIQNTVSPIFKKLITMSNNGTFGLNAISMTGTPAHWIKTKFHLLQGTDFVPSISAYFYNTIGVTNYFSVWGYLYPQLK